jgi:hypothetical protein
VQYWCDRLGGDDRPERLACGPQDASRCLSRNGIIQALRELPSNGLIEAAAPPRSPNRRYRLVQ